MSRGGDGSVAGEPLRTTVERIEALEAEKAGINDDLKAVYAEAKAEGYDPKTLRRVVKIRAKGPEKYREGEALLDTYMDELGMLPLFEGDNG